MTKVFHGESCEGAVTASWTVEGKKVTANYVDGDMGNFYVTYELTKQDENYRMVENVGFTRDRFEVPLRGKNEQSALRDMIRKIVDEQRKNKRESPESAFPIILKDLKKGLERALLS